MKTRNITTRRLNTESMDEFIDKVNNINALVEKKLPHTDIVNLPCVFNGIMHMIINYTAPDSFTVEDQKALVEGSKQLEILTHGEGLENSKITQEKIIAEKDTYDPNPVNSQSSNPSSSGEGVPNLRTEERTSGQKNTEVSKPLFPSFNRAKRK